MLELGDLYLLTACFIVIFWWWRSIKRREYAQWQAKQYCKKMDLQWLDQNLVLKKMRLQRSGIFYWQLERSFLFEFTTTGEQRYSGYILLLGERLSQIITDPYKKPETEFDESRDINDVTRTH